MRSASASRMQRQAAVAADETVKALGDRVAAVEASLAAVKETVAGLAAQPGPAAESERAARAVAIGVVRQAADRSGPFTADLAILQTLGIDAAAVADLQPLAEKGAPSFGELQKAFPGVANAILEATSAPGPDAGFLDRVAAFGRNLVTVRPTTAIPGATPEAIVSRMQAAVDRGDLAAALAEREGLPESGKTASAAFAQSATDRVAIDRLVGGLVQSLAKPAN